MSKQTPDYHDADLVLRLYEMRRESVMRESRAAINGQFWPKSWEEVLAVTKSDHPLNAPFRQTSSYWEMVFGMARHGIVHADYLAENTVEGFFLYAKMAPFLERYRKEVSILGFRNVEWIATESEGGRRMAEIISARVKKISESR
jgi:hypothetical protein